MDAPDCYFTSISKDLQKKRDYIANILREVGMNPVIPEGGYFIMADWSSLGKEKKSSLFYSFKKHVLFFLQLTRSI